ncbi:2-dehydropantoate 2-reductase [Candidatus Photodesmus blepharus]|uniref:2-dehydropantoate 2-reductase n=1 Tax=Candidatus Photodesmus blepharonis TaxID=1179155 RepID=A0A084CP35_9GAMM|nr:2-dehydropantoate 2-reductase [Candidatus Photodesmus blepharus]KEY91564.1 2-dehydropantoate 2-reductase [Candidatus Photodesmus blepharus]
MNIVVIGPGAIGVLWAYNLANSGHNVSVWGRSSFSVMNLQLGEEKRPFTNRNQEALVDADLILVTVKVWQIRNAILPIESYSHRDCIILLMHNGMGAVESIYSQICHHPVLLATTTHGAYKVNSMQAFHTGVGVTQIGGYNDKGKECNFLVGVLNQALPEVVWNSSIKVALWKKLAINCVINPLTAIEQCRNGKLAKSQYRSKLESLLNEVKEVMYAEGIEADLDDLKKSVIQVISATAENFSSMQQDIFYKRKTEIDFITGYLIDRAKLYGIPVPENSRLYQQIKAKENNK